jgi:hypothetical protein
MYTGIHQFSFVVTNTKMYINFIPTGQLFSETSLRALSAPSSSLSRLSALPRLLSLLEKHSSLSLQGKHSSGLSVAINSASHSLTLPLLRTVILSHDVSRDLKDVAVRVLCKAVEEFTSSYDEVHVHVCMYCTMLEI